MDQETRGEIDKLHHRINDMNSRVTTLEAQNPHINAALVRIEKSVEKLNAHIVKAIWTVLTAFLLVVVKFTLDGGWSRAF